MKLQLGLLALAATAYAHAHHDHEEAIPDHVREELLKKWDQEVCSYYSRSFLAVQTNVNSLVVVLRHRQLRALEAGQMPG